MLDFLNFVDNENIEYTVETAERLFEEAKVIALESEEKLKEVLAFVDKIISFLEIQEAKKQQ